MRLLRLFRKPNQRPPPGAAIDWGHPLAFGLVGCWAFNEGGGLSLRDLTGRGLTATLTNTPTWGVDNDGHVVKFVAGSSQYAVIANNPAFNAFGTGNFSAVCRVRLTATPSVDQDILSWDLNHGGNAAYWRLRVGSGPSLKFESQSGSFTGGTLANGTFYVLAVVREAGSARIYIDGKQVGSGASTSNISSATLNFYLATLAGAEEFLSANYSQVLLYNRALTASEIQQLVVEPWAMIAQPRRPTLRFAPATAYTLTADTGAFALTGQAAALKAARVLTAATGSFTLTGVDATLRAARALAAGQGSFALSGQAASLKANRRLPAAQGVFVLTGEAALLAVGKSLTAPPGSFLLSGQAASLTRQARLAAAAGNFALAGQAATLTTGQANRVLTAATGSFALVGGDVVFIKRGRSVAPPSEVSLTPVAPSGVQSGLYDESLSPQAPSGVTSGKGDVSLEPS